METADSSDVDVQRVLLFRLIRYSLGGRSGRRPPTRVRTSCLRSSIDFGQIIFKLWGKGRGPDGPEGTVVTIVQGTGIN